MQLRQDEVLASEQVSQGEVQARQFKPLGYVLAGQLSKQLLFIRYLNIDVLSHEVQFVLKVEHVRQGFRHPKQVALTKNREAS